MSCRSLCEHPAWVNEPTADQLISPVRVVNFRLVSVLGQIFWMAKGMWLCRGSVGLCCWLTAVCCDFCGCEEPRELVKTGCPKSAQEIWLCFVRLEGQWASLLAFVGSLTCWLLVGHMQDWWWAIALYTDYIWGFSGHTLGSMLIKFCGWFMWPFVFPLTWFWYILVTTAYTH